MKRLILLEDEVVLRDELVEFLSGLGHAVDAVTDLAQFHRVYDQHHHRIAIVDLGLPDGDGLALIRDLRSQKNPVGIVVLTARGSSRDRVIGLGDGADYYLSKTADLDELAATLAALSRRLGEPAPEPTATWMLELGPRRLLPPAGAAIALSQQDVTVLRALMEKPGEIISRQRIVEALGGDYLRYDQRRLDTQMRRLRRKVETATGESLPVTTARNAGYQFYAGAHIRG